jgi:cysteinyl-tRNA synthetase
MTIKLHNSLSRSIETFTPVLPGRARMYVCGPTVYDRPHLGNARPAVIFDVLFRLLIEEYGEGADYVRNYTDIDDKIMARALELDEDISVVTERAIRDYRSTMGKLNCLLPDLEPRATDAIDRIHHMIETLIANGNAYVVEGHVFFDVASWPEHGILSGHKQEDLESGAREIKGVNLKRAPSDFVLWKPSTDAQPGWTSPWGRGRPGWHIECSAMIDALYSSETIDIHGGGADLRFPHHECEISQFSACNHKPLANYWVHNGMVTVDGKKMAKSEGNFLMVGDVLEQHPGQAIRFALLSTHYRSSLDWTDKLLAAARGTLTGWFLALESIDAAPEANIHSAGILEALKSDLNTPMAITRIHEKMGEIGHHDPEEVAAGIRYGAKALGLDLSQKAGEEFLRGGSDREEIEMLIAQRIAARTARDFAESDRLRGILSDRGLVIEDGASGTRWRRS